MTSLLAPADAEIAFTVDTLQRVHRNQRVRLATAVALRNYVFGKLEAGEPCDHYRAKWLDTSIRSVIAYLEGLGRQFNADHPGDVFTDADMIDIILRSAMVTLLGAGEDE